MPARWREALRKRSQASSCSQSLAPIVSSGVIWSKNSARSGRFNICCRAERISTDGSRMIIKVCDDKPSLGRAAARQAAGAIRAAIQKNGAARLIAATGASQFELLDALTSLAGIDWGRVEMFHL